MLRERNPIEVARFRRAWPFVGVCFVVLVRDHLLSSQHDPIRRKVRRHGAFTITTNHAQLMRRHPAHSFSAPDYFSRGQQTNDESAMTVHFWRCLVGPIRKQNGVYQWLLRTTPLHSPDEAYFKKNDEFHDVCYSTPPPCCSSPRRKELALSRQSTSQIASLVEKQRSGRLMGSGIIFL